MSIGAARTTALPACGEVWTARRRALNSGTAGWSNRKQAAGKRATRPSPGGRICPATRPRHRPGGRGGWPPRGPKAAWTIWGPICRWSGPARPTCGRLSPTGIRCPRSGCGRRNCPAGRSCWCATARTFAASQPLRPHWRSHCRPPTLASQCHPDGDIFEIRSDLPQDRADVPEDRGLLTLRAGPGYRPAIAGRLCVACGSSLAIEGITFLKGSELKTEWKENLPLEKQGRIRRLASCASTTRKQRYCFPTLKWSAALCAGEVRLWSSYKEETFVRLRQCAVRGQVYCRDFDKVPPHVVLELDGCADQGQRRRTASRPGPRRAAPAAPASPPAAVCSTASAR